MRYSEFEMKKWQLAVLMLLIVVVSGLALIVSGIISLPFSFLDSNRSISIYPTLTPTPISTITPAVVSREVERAQQSGGYIQGTLVSVDTDGFITLVVRNSIEQLKYRFAPGGQVTCWPKTWTSANGQVIELAEAGFTYPTGRSSVFSISWPGETQKPYQSMIDDLNANKYVVILDVYRSSGEYPVKKFVVIGCNE